MHLWMTSFSERAEKIGGEDFYNYASCPTRLWLFHRNIVADMKNEHIRIGKHIDEVSHRRNKRKLTIPGLCSIDFVTMGEKFEVHEIKKGKEIKLAHRYQVLYYLEVIHELTGRDVRGYIHYPETRRVVELDRDPDTVHIAFNDILEILKGQCPKPSRIPICNGCSYEEMCWA